MDTEKDTKIAFKLSLLSPAGASTKKIKLSNSGLRSAYSGKDVVAILQHVCEEIHQLQETLQPLLEETYVGDLDSVTELVNQYNKHVAAMISRRVAEGSTNINSNTRASKSLLKFLIDLSYQRSVDARKLSKYRAFSAAVYGEAFFKLVEQIIGAVRFKETDVFVDMGSGVGKVVLLVAATTCCSSCWGIEKSQRRSRYAARLAKEFQRWMAWFGKECLSPFQLIHNDFTHREMIEKIKSSTTVVYANNLNFGDGVNVSLAEHFKALQLGSRIVSGQGFVLPRFKLNRRTAGNLGSMMTLTPLPPLEDAVSWTSTPVGFFLHTKYRPLPSGADEDNVSPQASSERQFFHSATVWRPFLGDDDDDDDDDDEGTTSRQARMNKRIYHSATVLRSSKDGAYEVNKSRRGKKVRKSSTPKRLFGRLKIMTRR